jgi:crotonobetainyl-CoA:carnitine CoA-transferase CaiB-like acyl-CoA transferase
VSGSRSPEGGRRPDASDPGAGVSDTTLPLAGYRVLDLSTVVAGPVLARNLGDYGAEVVKVEHPVHGDPARQMGWSVDGHSLWWKTLSRNKLPVTLDLSTPPGAQLCLRLVARCDVLVESFRPGTLERWGLGPDELHRANPELIIARVSGFGQTGPYAARPGFGTLAESMSGYAGLQGTEDGPPMLPAIALADESAGAYGAMATLAALLARERGHAGGQVVDVSLYEPLLAMLGPLPAVYDLTGEEAPRLGNRLPFAAPRGAYRTADDRWLGLSGTSPAVARRILLVVGDRALADDPRFATNAARLDHAEELDAVIADWVGRRTLAEALEAFEVAHAAAAPVYRMGDLFADPHIVARRTIERVPDADLGHVAMAAVVPRLSVTPGAIRWAGGDKGSANARVYGGLLGLDDAELAELAAAGVI